MNRWDNRDRTYKGLKLICNINYKDQESDVLSSGTELLCLSFTW